MKHLILSILLANTIACLVAQQTEPLKTNTSTDYFKKSKSQKTVGWILLGGGTAFLATSFVIPQGEFIGYSPDLKERYENDDLATALFLTGVVSSLASVPFFISSKKNKNKGMNISTSLKMEINPVMRPGIVINRTYPVLSVKFNIR